MILFIAIVGYIVTVYLAFAVNVFQFGLYLYDNAEGEAFEGISDIRKSRLNAFFADLAAFNNFVTLFDALAIIVTTALGLIIAGKISHGESLLYGIEVVLALIVTLFLNVVFAQTLSKRVPNKWINGTLRSRLTLIRILYSILGPFAAAMSQLAQKYKREQLSEEQKEDMVERALESLAETAGLDEPLVEEDEKEMIGNIFELDQTSVKELMVPRTEIVGIPETASFEEIQKIVVSSGHSRFPVSGEDLDDIKGIMYVKDLFGKVPFPEGDFRIMDYVRKAYFVPEKMVTSHLLNELKQTHNHMALVSDEYGGTAGLITMEDVLELIVGDIQDEHDSEAAEIVRMDDGRFKVDANVSIEELAEAAEIEIDDGEFETVGGLIYDLVGSLPRTGQTVSNDNFEFTVEKMDGQRIEVVIVTPIHH